MDDLENQLLVLLGALSAPLPEGDTESIRSLIAAGEYGIAFENLCTQLYEYEAVIPIDSLVRLKELGQVMALDKSLWENLSRACHHGQRGSEKEIHE